MHADGRLILRPGGRFNAVKVFSATVGFDRERLGERVTAWLAAHRTCQVTEVVVTQSSDDDFHCLVITVFHAAEGTARE